MSKQRTYWHLEGLRRVPSDYEVKSSRLLYYPRQGFEVRTPISDWYRRYQQGSQLGVHDWEAFSDPLETTYSTYVARQAERETFVDGLFRSIAGSRHDENLDGEWVRLLEGTLPVLRYPYHGLQMVAAYVAHLSPAGKLAILGTFQVADEMRKIQRFAYRMRQLQDAHPGFGENSKQAWLERREWQPLREVVEHLLVTYDYGEAFVTLNLLLKPALDHALLNGLSRSAENHGDAVMSRLFFSLGEDAHWHHDWALAFADYASASSPGTATAISDWVDRWQPAIQAAISALSDIVPSEPGFHAAIHDALKRLDRRAARCRA